MQENNYLSNHYLFLINIILNGNTKIIQSIINRERKK